MIEIRVVQIMEGPKRGKWIWKMRKRIKSKKDSGGKWIGRSMKEFVDAWEANDSAKKIKKDLEEVGCKNIKVFYGKYDIPDIHHKFYKKRTEARKVIKITPFGYGIVK